MRRPYCAFRRNSLDHWSEDGTHSTRALKPCTLAEIDEIDDKDTYSRIANPCTDIKTQLDAVLSREKSKKARGSFACFTSIDKAPTPGLDVSGVGNISIPISEDAIQEIINVCTPATSATSKGMKASKSKNTGGSWEIGASQLSFGNAHWTEWIKSFVVPYAAKYLDVTSVSSCELNRLVVYEAGASSPLVDADQSADIPDNLCARIFIGLPSRFEGGLLTISHGENKQTFDVAKESAFCTSILACHTDVQYESHYITSGFQVALCYDVFSPPGVPNSGFLGHSKTVAAMRHALLSWKQSFDASVPQKLAYVVNFWDESEGLIQRGHLEGIHIYTAKLLRALAKECHFDVYLANAELQIATPALYEEYDSEDDVGIGRDDGPDRERQLSFSRIVDLDGKDAGFSDLHLKFKHPEEFFPDSLDSGEPVDVESEAYSSTYYRADIRHYEEKVILMWPRNRREAVFGKDWLAGAVEKLKTTVSTSATPAEKKIAERMIYHLEGGDTSVAACRELCASALRWNDFELWLRAARVSDVEHASPSLSFENLIDAIATFGFDDLKPLVTTALTNTSSNAYRLALLTAISESPLSEQSDVTIWCKEQQDRAVQNLRIVKLDDVPALVSIARLKGIKFFKSTVIPQLFSMKCEREIWLALLPELQSERLAIPPSLVHVDYVIDEVLTSLILNIEPFAAKPKQPWDRSPPDYDPRPVIDAIKLCHSLNALTHCNKILKTLQESDNIDPEIRKARASRLYGPIMAAVVSINDPEPSIRFDTPSFHAFSKFAVNEILEDALHAREPAWERVVKATRLLGIEGVRLLESKLGPLFSSSNPASKSSAIAGALKEAWVCTPNTPERDAVNKLITRLVEVSIAKENIMFDSKDTYEYWKPWLGNSLALLKLCLAVKSEASLPELFSRLMSPTQDLDEHFTKVVLPFVSALCKELADRKIDVFSEPYRRFCEEALTTFTNKILGTRPGGAENASSLSEALAVLGCGCEPCNEMIEELSTPETTITIKRAEKERKHLIKRIGKKMGITCRTVKSGSPHGLEITKPASLINWGNWAKYQKKALDVLTAIGSVDIQRKVLGQHFTGIYDRLGLLLPEENPVETQDSPTPAIETPTPNPNTSQIGGPEQTSRGSKRAVSTLSSVEELSEEPQPKRRKTSSALSASSPSKRK
ncbi:hypothetical protein SISSUDRAFT_1131296 [Sistotremastrum suecicum HHB10207 ss-3]|uniref:Uncharacterized protein n=1 Tax=Sistotremastrum suecicum HHB10207 ss-3 TaxID=1314776 RepID=A0A166ABP0_9AGAM|nr:hypothetical protein SISSUDRAFT_1131296 [Sistotremastrum suecicum HHB10207 ss-3]